MRPSDFLTKSTRMRALGLSRAATAGTSERSSPFTKLGVERIPVTPPVQDGRPAAAGDYNAPL